jgi:hypothetical protein
MLHEISTTNMDDLKKLNFSIGEVLQPFCKENFQIISAKLLSELEMWQNKSHPAVPPVFDSNFCDKDFFLLIRKTLMILYCAS